MATTTAHYLLQAGAALSSACRDFGKGAQATMDSVRSLKREADGVLTAVRGHVDTAKHVQGLAASLADGTVLDGVKTELTQLATGMIDGVIETLSSLIPPETPVLLDLPEKLARDVTQLAQFDPTLPEFAHYLPPVPDLAEFLPDLSILGETPHPQPFALANALGVLNETGRDLLEGVYPDGEIDVADPFEENA